MEAPHSTALQAEIDLLKKAIDSSICGVTIADARLPDMPLIFINEAFETLTGYKSSEVLGKNCRFLQGDLKEQSDLEVLRESIQKKVSCKVLLKNFKKNGRPFWNELILSPVIDENNEVTHFIGIQNDVTEREGLRIELKQSERELQMAIKQLKKLIEDKNRLLSIVAHDLRSPLSNIIGLNQQMLDDAEINDPSGYMDITLAEARNAYELVSDLLNKQSIESGKLTIDKRPTDLAEFSASMARTLGAKAARKNIDLTFDDYLDVPTFHMDASKVKQVVQNLVDNAIKFSERGSKIEVELRASESRMSLIVCDNGQGIIPEEIDKIFESFETSLSKSTEGETSYGVGLSVVKEIVELHGGEISVESAVAEGTCFTVLLW